MFVAHALVTVVAAAADPYAATNAIMRPKWLLATMTKLGVPESWITKSGLLKAAGAVVLLIGIGVPLVGTAAAVGLVLTLSRQSLPTCAHATTLSVQPLAFHRCPSPHRWWGRYAKGR